MKRVLLTGMSGTGKSTVTEELAARGYHSVDADGDELSHFVDAAEGEVTGVGNGRDWVWREDRMEQLLSTDDGELLFLSGCSPNQGRFYPRFDHIILLSAPAEVIAQRLAARTNNPFGKDPQELARTLQLKDTIEPLLRRGADLEVDTTAPVGEVVAAILQHVQEPPTADRGP